MINEDKVGTLFTTNGKDVWKLITYCEYPTATFVNVETKEQTGGAVGSPIVNQFKELEIKKEVKDASNN